MENNKRNKNIVRQLQQCQTRVSNIGNHANRFAGSERREVSGWDAGNRPSRPRGGWGKQAKKPMFSIISRGLCALLGDAASCRVESSRGTRLEAASPTSTRPLRPRFVGQSPCRPLQDPCAKMRQGTRTKRGPSSPVAPVGVKAHFSRTRREAALPGVVSASTRVTPGWRRAQATAAETASVA